MTENKKNIFQLLKTGLKRTFQSNNDFVDSKKLYGNYGELNFYQELARTLPASAEIRRNIIIKTENREAEIDMLVIYYGKIFAIELKRWKGKITNRGDTFYQIKQGSDGGGAGFRKEQQSPFRQLSRSIYLLKESTVKSVYINPIVYFLDNDDVHIRVDTPWFNSIDALVNHIKTRGRPSEEAEIEAFMNWVVVGDKTYGRNEQHEVTGIINSYTLQFETEKGTVKKDDIDYIIITHHFSYDDLDIHLTDGSVITVKEDNRYIIMEHGKSHDTFYLSKIDMILIGK